MSTSMLSPLHGELHKVSTQQVDTPPSSPSYTDGKLCFGTQASSQHSPILDADNGAFDIQDAKKAVYLAGYSLSVINLVIEYHKRQCGTDFKTVQDLFFAVEDVVDHPHKQQRYAQEIFRSRQAEKGAAVKQVVTIDDRVGESHHAVTEKPVSFKDKMRTLTKENKILRKRKMCRSCEKVELATSGMTFLPCGHFVTCEECAEKYDDCPACGKKILGTVRTFLS